MANDAVKHNLPLPQDRTASILKLVLKPFLHSSKHQIPPIVILTVYLPPEALTRLLLNMLSMTVGLLCGQGRLSLLKQRKLAPTSFKSSVE